MRIRTQRSGASKLTQEASFSGDCHRLRAIASAQLLQDVFDTAFDRLFGNAQYAADDMILFSLCYQS